MQDANSFRNQPTIKILTLDTKYLIQLFIFAACLQKPKKRPLPWKKF